jgi:hypothetical protein
MTMMSSAEQEIDERQLSRGKFLGPPECDVYLPRGCFRGPFRGQLRGPFRGPRSRILPGMVFSDDLGRGGWIPPRDKEIEEIFHRGGFRGGRRGGHLFILRFGSAQPLTG